jgi:cell division protein FtsI/penicillin-binding protein 2
MKLYSYNRRKIYFTCIAIVMTAVFLMGRLAYLMVAKADYYNRAATGLHERERSIKAPRGEMEISWLIIKQSVPYRSSTARLRMKKQLYRF